MLYRGRSPQYAVAEQPRFPAGDLDSIKPEVSSFYSERGAKVVDESYDQDSTDLQKCLNHISDLTKTSGADEPTIIAAGARGAPACALSPRQYLLCPGMCPNLPWYPPGVALGQFTAGERCATGVY